MKIISLKVKGRPDPFDKKEAHMLFGKKMAFLVMFAGVCIFLIVGYAVGGMKIQLNNGKVIDVPVNKKDIFSITFDNGLKSTGLINWDFETGDLKGWTKTGTAFDFQPTYGDNPTARHRGQPSNHQGQYLIGGYEKRPRPSGPAGQTQGDGPQGTLVSQSFKITQPFIDFLIEGGCDINKVRVELLIDGQVVYKTTGKCTETMVQVSWNVMQFVGKTAQVRIVDNSSGGWGHINFDDLKFN